MFELDIFIVLGIAFSLGMLHAFDADHIAMVTTLSSTQQQFKKSILYCLRWALGHALTLMVLGALVFILGLHIPEQLSQYAEIMVALLLIAMGGWLLWQLRQQKLHIHFHQHDGSPPHAHWHSHQSGHGHQHQHHALFIGSLHGLAGSAPLLAVIPLATQHPPSFALLYLCIFSFGVVISMLAFGGLLHVFARSIDRFSLRGLWWFKLVISVVSTIVGSLLMMRAIA